MYRPLARVLPGCLAGDSPSVVCELSAMKSSAQGGGAVVVEVAKPAVADVLAAIAVRTEVNVADLAGRGRTRDISYARHLAMYLLFDYRLLWVAGIGRLLCRDHSTVLEGIKRIELETATRPETVQDLAAIRHSIGERSC
jgi:hypothetical protein